MAKKDIANIRLSPQWRHFFSLKNPHKYLGSAAPEAGTKGMDNELHPTDTVGCNYLSLPLVPASGTRDTPHISLLDVQPTLIPTLINNHRTSKVWDEITHSFPVGYFVFSRIARFQTQTNSFGMYWLVTSSNITDRKEKGIHPRVCYKRFAVSLYIYLHSYL